MEPQGGPALDFLADARKARVGSPMVTVVCKRPQFVSPDENKCIDNASSQHLNILKDDILVWETEAVMAAHHSAPLEDRNRTAVDTLWADAEIALALAELTTAQDNREAIEQTIFNVRRAYFDLSRRRASVRMTAEEFGAFQVVLDRLKARLGFFGESV